MDHYNGTSIATNTLLMPDIPLIFFNCPQALEQLRAKFDTFGAIYAFVAMKGFRRFMIVFHETSKAMQTKQILDKTELVWRKENDAAVIISIGETSTDLRPDDQVLPIRLYYGQHNPINPDLSTLRLKVPEAEKNFLISPPGSPVEGWEQIRESPPNTNVLASDLTHAIDELSGDDMDDLENFSLESPPEKEQQDKTNAQDIQPKNETENETPHTLKVVCKDNGLNVGADNVPSIVVQNWDMSALRVPPKRRIARTPLPRI